MLLAALHAIEAEAGRVRTVRNAARPLDLDLIAMDGLVRGTPPILPHPRAHLRAFVLMPLRDVAPEWRDPVSGRTPGEMLAANTERDCKPVTEDDRRSRRQLAVGTPYSPPDIVPALPVVHVGEAPQAPRELYPERSVGAELAWLQLLHHHHGRRHLNDLSRLHIPRELHDLLSG